MNTSVVHFERNFIRTAVCELRFPTLFEIDSDKPPLSLARSLRKEYPMYELQDELNVLAGRPAKSRAHLFTSKRSIWKVSLRSSAILLETSRYDSFPEFRKRLAFIVEAAKETIDSDFFTRVGLRYINAIPFNGEDIGKWINPSLVGILSDGAYGGVQECFQRVMGLTQFGGYLFQHGLEQTESGKTGYILDYDFFSEEIAVANVLDIVDELHFAEYSMFSRALGDRAKEYLGPSTLQKKENGNV